MTTWGIERRLFAVDVLMMAFATAIGAGTLVVLPRVPAWLEIVVPCALIVAGVPLVAWLRTHLDLAPIRALHDWALIIVILVTYRAVVLLAGPAHGGQVVDPWLVAADRWLFGTDPTVWLHRIASPALTEVLQIAYALFFTFPILVAAEVYARRSDSEFRQWMFTCGAACFLAYAGYLLLPAVGPRFTLHDVSALDRELPGLWLTPTLRAATSAGGPVAAGMQDSVAMAGAARDGFPSGHVAVTVVAIWWGWVSRLRVRWVLSVAGALMAFGAVYLRYHYVVDVLAGVAVAGLCLAVAPSAHDWLAIQLRTFDERRRR
jgi:membrane-associated phospholipid phosphatase